MRNVQDYCGKRCLTSGRRIVRGERSEPLDTSNNLRVLKGAGIFHPFRAVLISPLNERFASLIPGYFLVLLNLLRMYSNETSLEDFTLISTTGVLQ